MTTPTTSRVSETMFYVACAAYKEVSGEPVRMASLRAALEAALASLGAVVAVSELEALITFHSGMMVKEENEDVISGAATVIADLSAILNRGGK